MILKEEVNFSKIEYQRFRDQKKDTEMLYAELMETYEDLKRNNIKLEKAFFANKDELQRQKNATAGMIKDVENIRKQSEEGKAKVIEL